MNISESDFLKVIEQGKKEGKEFIKWWRKESDFVDFELIDRYLQAEDARHDFENFDLLDKQEMWKVLQEQVPGELYHRVATQSDTIEWQRIDKDGKTQTYVCPYNAHSMMSIFDAETKGQTLL
jgi:hypothetical protein